MADHSIEYDIRGDASNLINALRRVEAELTKASGKRYSVRLNAESQGAERAFDELERRAKSLEKNSPHLTVRLAARDFLRELNTVSDDYDEFISGVRNKEITPQFKQANIARIKDFVKEGDRLKGSLGRLERAGAAGASMDKLGNTFSKVASKVRRLPALFGGMAIVLISALVPAVLAAVTALGGLLGAVAGLGSALALAAGPAVGLLVALFSRIAKVMEAFKTRQQSKDADTRKGASASVDAAAKEDAMASALEGVRDALQQVSEARRQYKEAVAQASEEITEAQKAEQEASRELKEAQADLGQAAKDAYREMRDAILDAQQAVLDLQSAQLSADEANLSVRDAKDALKDFQEEMGKTGKGWGSMLEKFTDVDVDIDPNELRKAASKATGAKKDSDEARELERLILNLRRARLGEKEAINGVKGAENDLTDARATAAAFQRQGIGASESYRSAQERLRSAQTRYTEAVREATKLERQGIQGAPAVISAKKAIQDAEEGVVRARRAVASASRDQAGAVGGLSAQDALYQKRRAALSATEKRLLDLLIGMNATMKALRPATDAIIAGMVDGFNKLKPVFPIIQSAMIVMGRIWGGLIRQFAAKLLAGDNLAKLGTGLDGAIKLSRIFGGAFLDIAQIIINLGSAAMPLLVNSFRNLANHIKGIAGGTGGLEHVRNLLRPMVTLVDDVVDTVFALGRALIGSFNAASGPVGEFITWIRKGIEAFAKWTESAKGKEQIREFFEDVIPFAKTVISSIIKIGAVILKAMQIILPILDPVLQGFNFFLDIILWLLKALDFLIGPFKTIIGWVVALISGMGVINRIPNLLKGVIAGVRGLFGGLGGLFKTFGGTMRAVVGFIGKVVGRVGRILGGIGGKIKAGFQRIGPALSAVLKFVTAPIRFVIRTFLSLVRFVISVPGKIGRALRPVIGFVRKIIDRVGGVFHRITAIIRAVVDRAGKIFGGLGKIIARGWRGAVGIFKTVANGFIKLVNIFIRGFNKVFKARKIKGPGPLPDINFPGFHIDSIKPLAAGGIVTGATNALIGESGDEAVVPLRRSVLRELGRSIIAAVGSPGLNPAFAGAARMGLPRSGAGGTHVEKQEINLPPAPGAAVPDARFQAAQFALEMSRRGLT